MNTCHDTAKRAKTRVGFPVIFSRLWWSIEPKFSQVCYFIFKLWYMKCGPLDNTVYRKCLMALNSGLKQHLLVWNSVPQWYVFKHISWQISSCSLSHSFPVCSLYALWRWNPYKVRSSTLKQLIFFSPLLASFRKASTAFNWISNEDTEICSIILPSDISLSLVKLKDLFNYHWEETIGN